MVAGALENDSFWPKNHFFTTVTPKPAYIYPNKFSKENFQKKNLVPWDPLGVPGVPISGSPRLNIFQMCFSQPLGPPGSPHTFKCNGGLQKTYKFSKGL